MVAAKARNVDDDTPSRALGRHAGYGKRQGCAQGGHPAGAGVLFAGNRGVPRL